MSNNVNDLVTVTTGYILQGAGNIEADGVDLGSFQGGVKVNWGQTEAFVTSDYALGPVKSEIMQVEYSISTELEEATMINLAIAWGLHSSSVVSVVSSSSSTLDLIPLKNMREIQLVFLGMSAENNELHRKFTVHRAVRVGSSQSSLQRGTKTVIPVTFKALLNSSNSFGTIVEYGKGDLNQ